MELLTGFGLANAAGLNAYIPLLALGLLARFTDLVNLPHSWAWLENGLVIGIVAVLLAVEDVADKIPLWTASTTSSRRSSDPPPAASYSARARLRRRTRSPTPVPSPRRANGFRSPSASSSPSSCT